MTEHSEAERIILARTLLRFHGHQPTDAPVIPDHSSAGSHCRYATEDDAHAYIRCVRCGWWVVVRGRPDEEFTGVNLAAITDNCRRRVRQQGDRDTVYAPEPCEVAR